MAKKIYENKKTKNRPTIVQEKIDAGQMAQYAEEGLYHTPFSEENITYKAAPNERVISNAGSYIVLGTDRPDSTASGLGAMGSNRANTIDLVVGRMASANGGEGPPGQEDGTAQVDNSYSADAARILISQLTDVDKHFGLAKGYTPLFDARSAIAIKADVVRVIGREGVNIVTGKAPDVEGHGSSGEENSLGGRIVKRAPSINLIAGNHTGTYITFGGIPRPIEKINNLQPAVRGLLARDAFLERDEILEDIISILTINSLTNKFHNSVLASLFPFWLWPASFGNFTWYSAMAYPWIDFSLYQVRNSLNLASFNYCNPSGYKYICSRNVNIT